MINEMNEKSTTLLYREYDAEFIADWDFDSENGEKISFVTSDVMTVIKSDPSFKTLGIIEILGINPGNFNSESEELNDIIDRYSDSHIIVTKSPKNREHITFFEKHRFRSINNFVEYENSYAMMYISDIAVAIYTKIESLTTKRWVDALVANSDKKKSIEFSEKDMTPENWKNELDENQKRKVYIEIGIRKDIVRNLKEAENLAGLIYPGTQMINVINSYIDIVAREIYEMSGDPNILNGILNNQTEVSNE